MAEEYGKSKVYFDLTDIERTRLRKMVVEYYINQEPAWLREWEQSLEDVVEHHRQMARPFAIDLLASRMTMIWQNNLSQEKRKFIKSQKNEGERDDTKRIKLEQRASEDPEKTCDGCNVQMVLKWCCPICEVKQTKQQTDVFLP